MDFTFTPEQNEFRKKFTEWLKKTLPPDWDPANQPKFETDEAMKKAYQDFQKKLFDAGYAAMHYPKEYGGGGMTVNEELIVLQTIASTCYTLKTPGVVTHAMAVPVMAECGSEKHKKELLPRTLDGTYVWCQGFSEPDAGSDVANIQTLAIKEGDHYVVNGQKVWTSMAHIADYCMLVVRTDPDSKKHRGLSYLFVDMSLPGIDVRPMKQITGESEFNEVFFTDVKVPADMLVGEEGGGWMIAITTLMFERVMGDVLTGSAYESNVHKMIEMARLAKHAGKPVLDNPVYRQQLAQAYIEVMALKYHGLRNFSNQAKGEMPGPEGSIGKLLWSEPNQRISETAIGFMGSGSTITSGPFSIHDGFWQYSFLRSKGNTIEAGTSEIQRNIIGERVLGLPKDASRSLKK